MAVRPQVFFSFSYFQVICEAFHGAEQGVVAVQGYA